MIKVAVIGLGKMGISHLAILGAHKDVNVVGVAETSKLITGVLKKFTQFNCFADYKEMLDIIKPEAVFVAVPTKYHTSVVSELIERNIHVFVEKPFCLDIDEGNKLVKLAHDKNIVNQVGYHNRFVGTFERVKEIIEAGYLGDIKHFSGEINGPVITKKKEGTWRSKAEEGGGCLMDYASHIIDLVHFLFSPIKKIHGVILKSIFSESVEDSAYSLVETGDGISGIIAVNWSDESYRKMSVSITINGTKGKIISDSTELKIFFNNSQPPGNYKKGWNIEYITEFVDGINFYLRGEEYSAQVDCFIDAVMGRRQNNKNTFETAWQTDNVIQQIKRFNN